MSVGCLGFEAINIWYSRGTKCLCVNRKTFKMEDKIMQSASSQQYMPKAMGTLTKKNIGTKDDIQESVLHKMGQFSPQKLYNRSNTSGSWRLRVTTPCPFLGCSTTTPSPSAGGSTNGCTLLSCIPTAEPFLSGLVLATLSSFDSGALGSS